MQIRLNDSEMFNALNRSALLVAVVFRMLIGLGLALALVVKMYMLILTDFSCQTELMNLGNSILCTSVLDMIATSIFLVTGLGFAVGLISTHAVRLSETLLMGMCGVVIAFIAELSVESASWETAIVIFSLFVPISVLIILSRWTIIPTKSTDSSEET